MPVIAVGLGAPAVSVSEGFQALRSICVDGIPLSQLFDMR